MSGDKSWFAIACAAVALLLAVEPPGFAAAQVRAGPSAAKPLTEVQTIHTGPGGVPSYKNDTVLGLMAPSGHYTTLDIIAYTGQRTAGGAYGGIQTEVYGCTNAAGCTVPGGQVSAAYAAAAFNGVGDTTDAATLMMTTEA